MFTDVPAGTSIVGQIPVINRTYVLSPDRCFVRQEARSSGIAPDDQQETVGYMAGHLFTCKCDITKLACDAWLLPVYAEQRIEDIWMNQCLAELGPGDGSLDAFALPDAFPDERRSALPRAWPAESPYPMPVATVIGSTQRQEISWYIDGVRQFIEACQRSDACFLQYRQRPLLAIPLVGVERGGAGDRIAEVIAHLLEFALEAVETCNVDIVIAIKNPIHYTVCQMQRKHKGADRFFQALSVEQKEAAARIADYAKKGELVLFLGAGVSAGAGLPSWGQLLAHLSDRAQLSPEQAESLGKFNFLDQAEILKRGLDKLHIDMNQEIVNILSAKHIYSLGHALISDWPANEAVTQNYDTMFESACRDSGQPLSVIPYRFDHGTAKWLLKMHGCITAPDDIVLTRSDYLDYDYTRSALSGIVQALLVTKHMLFLGFSLTDDHFIELIFDVHKAVEGMMSASDDHTFGSVLTPVHSELQEELWKAELDFIAAGDSDMPFAECINVHDIILDYITCLAHTSHRYLFYEEFESLMSESELTLRDSLLQVYEQIKSIDNNDVVQGFEDYMKSLGFRQ